MSNNVTNVLIVGVGGQGTILASRILTTVIQQNNYDVKLSEIHGMAQRGGSVVTQVRFGDSVNSPLVELNNADYILSFELLEGLRWLPYLKKDGVIIVNKQQIEPMPVIIGKQQYPDQIERIINDQVSKAVFFEALPIAEALGNTKVLNVILIGVLARYLPFSLEDWMKAIEEKVPAKALEINKKAFLAGYQA
ncbi:MAG TPA: indolepyruvate oxidoreductase subunit beta [Clostridia bacterium]|nr:indolepyruvate oxidoreductase subunit beta [Clostridia bacterium]